jgi:tRNA(Ile)-lysidine synthase
MALIESIREQLTRLQATPSDSVVAVSGGADSVALLHALIRLRGGSSGQIIIAHLNHCLRGEESDRDEQFVRNLHATLIDAGVHSIALAIARLDVKAIAAQSGDNLEAAARRERYAWLAEVAKQFGVSHVATGHTADDQAETILHRLLRGTGLQGLRGIAPRRELRARIQLIRPMLTATRAEVLEFLNEIKQPFCEDCTNRDLSFTRNRIRHQLLPLLQADYNAAIVPLLGQLAEQASEVYAEIEQAALQLLRECELPPAGSLRILDARKLAGRPRHLVREAIRLLWDREGWGRDAMRYRDWERAAAAALGELAAVDLPGRIRVRRKGNIVQIGADD